MKVGIKELSAGTTCSQAGETEQGEAGEKTNGHLALTSFQVPGSQVLEQSLPDALDSPEATRVGPVHSLLHLVKDINLAGLAHTFPSYLRSHDTSTATGGIPENHTARRSGPFQSDSQSANPYCNDS